MPMPNKPVMTLTCCDTELAYIITTSEKQTYNELLTNFDRLLRSCKSIKLI